MINVLKQMCVEVYTLYLSILIIIIINWLSLLSLYVHLLTRLLQLLLNIHEILQLNFMYYMPYFIVDSNVFCPHSKSMVTS